MPKDKIPMDVSTMKLTTTKDLSNRFTGTMTLEHTPTGEKVEEEISWKIDEAKTMDKLKRELRHRVMLIARDRAA